MGKKRSLALAAAVCVAAVFIIDCKKTIPAPEPMGDAAPTFAKGGSIQEFVVGKWCPATGIDAEKAEKFGVDPGSEIDVSEYWEFAADKTFIYTHTGSKDKVHGKWEVYGEAVGLTYEKWNEENINDARARFQKEAEGGTEGAIAKNEGIEMTFNRLFSMNYLVVSEDMKGLLFTDSSNVGGGGGAMFSMTMDTPLARMK